MFVAAEAVLLVADLSLPASGTAGLRPLRRLVDLTTEDSIGTWVSTTQLLVVSATAALIGFRLRSDDSGTRFRTYAWYAIAGLFVYMSFDDGSMFHERIGTSFGTHAPVLSDPALAAFFKRLLAAFPSYFWQIVFVPFFALAGLALLAFLAREMSEPRSYGLVVAGLGLYALAVMLDFLEDADAGMELLRSSFQVELATMRHGARAVEEYIEMLGTTMLLTAFLAHLAEVATGWKLEFVASGASRAERAGVSEPAAIGRRVTVAAG